MDTHGIYAEHDFGGYGRKHIEYGGGKYRVRIYGQYMKTRTGKNRQFKSYDAADKAANAWINGLRRSAEAARKAMLCA